MRHIILYVKTLKIFACINKGLIMFEHEAETLNQALEDCQIDVL